MTCVKCGASLQPPGRFCGGCGSQQPAEPITGPFHYSGPGGQGEHPIDAIAGFVTAAPDADHFLWKEGFDDWKGWSDLPIVAEAVAKAQELAAEDPAKVAEYEAMFQQFMSDGVLEEWERRELADARSHFNVSIHTHERLLKAHQESRTAALKVQIDQASMRSFRAQQFCVIRLRLANAGDKGLRTIKVQAVTSSTKGLVQVDSPGVGPGRDEVVTVRLKPEVAGQHELRALFTTHTYTGKASHFRTRAVVFTVAQAHGQAGTQVYNMDLSAMQVGKIGNMGAQQDSSAGLGVGGEWVELSTTPISDQEADAWLRKHSEAAPPPAPQRSTAPVTPVKPEPRPSTQYHYTGPTGEASTPINANEVVKRILADPTGEHHVWAEGFASWKLWTDVAALCELHAEASPASSGAWAGLASHITDHLRRVASRDTVAFTMRSDVHAVDLGGHHCWRVVQRIDTAALLAAGAVKGWTRRDGKVLACVDGPSLLATNQNDVLLRAITESDERPVARLLRSLAGQSPSAQRELDALPLSALTIGVLATARLKSADEARSAVRSAAQATNNAGDLFELVRLTRHVLDDETRALRLVESVAHDTRLQERVGLSHPVARSAWLAQARAQLLGASEEAQEALKQISSTALSQAPAKDILDHLAARAMVVDDRRGLVRAITRVQVGLTGSRRPLLGAGLAHAWVLLAEDDSGAREALGLESGDAAGWTAAANAWLHLLGDERKALALMAEWEARASTATELVTLCRIHRTVLGQPDDAKRTLSSARDRANTVDEWRMLAGEAHAQGNDAQFFRIMLGWREAVSDGTGGVAPLLAVATAWSELAGDIDEAATVLEAASDLVRAGRARGDRAAHLESLADAFETLADDPAAAARLRVEAERPASAPPRPTQASQSGGFPEGVTLTRAASSDNTRVKSIGTRPGGDEVVVGTSNHKMARVRVSDLQQLAQHSRHTDWVRGAALSHDGRLIASGCDDGKVVLWDLEDNEQIEETVHSDYVRDIVFERGTSGWEQRFVTVGDDGVVSMRKHREELWRFKHDSGTRAVDFTVDNARIWVGLAEFGNNLIALDASTGTKVATLEGHNDWINALRISPDGRWMATGSDDDAIKVWDLQSNSLKHTLNAHGDDINDVAWHPDSRMLAATADDGRLSIWDAHTGALLQVLEEGESADGEAIAFVNGGRELLWADDTAGLRRFSWAPSGAVDLQQCAACSARTNALEACSKHPQKGDMCESCLSDHKEESHCTRCDAIPAGGVEWCDHDGCPDTDKVCPSCMAQHKQSAHGIRAPGKPTVGGTKPGAKPGQGVRLQVSETRAMKTVRGLATALAHSDFVIGTNDNTVERCSVTSLSTKHTHKQHTDWVRAVAISHDAKYIASGCDDGHVVIWDNSDQEKLKATKAHSDYVRAVVFEPAALGNTGYRRIYVSGGDDEKVIKHVRGKAQWTANLGDQIHALAWTPNGRRIWAGLADGTENLACIDPNDGDVIRKFEAHGDWVRAVESSPCSDYLATGCDEGIIKIWHITKGSLECQFTLRGHTGHVRALAWHPTEPKLASVAEGGRLNIWHTKTGLLLGILELSGELYGVGFVDGGKSLIVAGGEDEGDHPPALLRRIDLQPGPAPTTETCSACSALSIKTQQCDKHTNLGGMCSSCLAEHRKLKHCASCDATPSTDPVWCNVSGCPDTKRLCPSCLNQHKRSAHPELSRTGTMTGSVLTTQHKRSFNKGLSIALSNSGQHFALSNRQHAVERCSLSNLNAVASHKQHTDWVRALAMSDDGRLIASGCDDGHVVVWDTSDGEELVQKRSHTDYVRSIAFERNASGYKQRYVSGGDDYRVVMRRRDNVEWDVNVGSQGRALQFTKDNRKIWVGLGAFGDNLIQLDASSGRKLATVVGHTDWINTLEISPDGRRLATGADDNSVKIWENHTRRLVFTLKGHSDDVNDLSWHPDSRTLAVAGEDGRVTVWDTRENTLLAKRDFGGDVQAIAFIEGGKVLLVAGDPMGVVKLKWK